MLTNRPESLTIRPALLLLTAIIDSRPLSFVYGNVKRSQLNYAESLSIPVRAIYRRFRRTGLRTTSSSSGRRPHRRDSSRSSGSAPRFWEPTPAGAHKIYVTVWWNGSRDCSPSPLPCFSGWWSWQRILFVLCSGDKRSSSVYRLIDLSLRLTKL